MGIFSRLRDSFSELDSSSHRLGNLAGNSAICALAAIPYSVGIGIAAAVGIFAACAAVTLPVALLSLIAGPGASLAVLVVGLTIGAYVGILAAAACVAVGAVTAAACAVTSVCSGVAACISGLFGSSKDRDQAAFKDDKKDDEKPKAKSREVEKSESRSGPSSKPNPTFFSKLTDGMRSFFKSL